MTKTDSPPRSPLDTFETQKTKQKNIFTRPRFRPTMTLRLLPSFRYAQLKHNGLTHVQFKAEPEHN